MKILKHLMLLACVAAPLSSQAGEAEPAGHAHGIAALPAAQREGLLSGKGLGMAAAAEANGYPGPLHVLELDEALRLTPGQRREAQRLLAEMKAEAVALGRRIVEEETALDALFRQRRASLGEIEAATAAIAALHGRLRAVHLRQHLRMFEVLSPEQIEIYYRRRGGHGA